MIGSTFRPVSAIAFQDMFVNMIAVHVMQVAFDTTEANKLIGRPGQGQVQDSWAFGSSIALIGLPARDVLDPLAGAFAQSAAVFVVVANSARILRFGNPAVQAPLVRGQT
jgi:hypothetical protein